MTTHKQIEIKIADLLELLDYCDLSKNNYNEKLKGVHFETRNGAHYAVALTPIKMLEIRLKTLDPEIKVTLQPVNKVKFPKRDYNRATTITQGDNGAWLDNHGNAYKENQNDSYPNWKCCILKDDTPPASNFCLWDGKVMDLLRTVLYCNPNAIVQQDGALDPAMIKVENKTYLYMPMRSNERKHNETLLC